MTTYTTRDEAITCEITELIQALENDDFDNITTEENTVTVTHDNDYSAEITPKYSNDGHEWYLTSYDAVLTTPQGETEEWWYRNLDLLCAALKKQEAIDPDATTADFIKKVDDLFTDDIWGAGSTLDEVIACWEPNDFDDAAYKDQVNVVGVVDIRLNVHGEVEYVDLVALGDFWGEDAETLSVHDRPNIPLEKRVVEWFRDVIAEHIIDEDDE